MEQGKKYECLLFDVDDTLYPLSSGLSKQCASNILEYMVERLGIDQKKVFDMNHSLYKNYGTSMAGLRAIGFDFDYDEYHRFVHGRLPYDTLNPDYHLRNLLLSLPLRKVIFSNADKVHVGRVLSKLKLEDCFDEIICFETLNHPHPPPSRNGSASAGNNIVESHISENCYGINNNGSPIPPTPIFCKPQEISFQVALQKAKIDPQKTLFFDDSIRNIQAAKRVGLHTVLVGSCVESEDVDYAIERIHNMKEVLPHLWQLDHHFDKSLNPRICRKMPITAMA